MATHSELIETLLAEEEERLRSRAALRDTARTLRSRDFVDPPSSRPRNSARTMGMFADADSPGLDELEHFRRTTSATFRRRLRKAGHSA
jgi:hypothetical protein